MHLFPFVDILIIHTHPKRRLLAACRWNPKSPIIIVVSPPLLVRAITRKDIIHFLKKLG